MRPCRFEICFRLTDFLDARAVSEELDGAFLRRQLGACFRDGEGKLPGLQTREHLPFFHRIAFLGQKLAEPVTAAERKGYLAHVDVSGEL